MSNYLALATVTEALSYRLGKVVEAMGSEGRPNESGTAVTTVNPKQFDPSKPAINLFLHQVSPNTSGSNDLPTRSATGQLLQRPAIQVDMHYLLTFLGPDQVQCQRLMGRVMAFLHATPILPSSLLREVSVSPKLQGSDLDAQSEPIRLAILPLSTDELQKLWSTFYQVPYRLSLAVQVTGIRLDGEQTPAPAITVRSLRGDARGSLPPRIEAVVVRGDELVLHGAGLPGPTSIATIAGRSFPLRELAPRAGRDGQLILNWASIASELPAGMLPFQLIEPDSDPQRPPAVASNVAMLVHRPRIRRSELDQRQLELGVVPPLRGGQELELLLHPLGGGQPGVTLHQSLAETAAPAVDCNWSLPDELRGSYLVRLRVDHVEALFTPDVPVGSPADPPPIGPEISLA